MDSPKLCLEKLRCVSCRNGSILQEGSAFQCGACGASCDSVAGVPFIGNYESDDLLGLIEIAAVKEMGTTIDEESVRRIEKLCEGYFDSGENPKWLASQADEFARQYWFPYRYSEWRDFRLVSDGIDWHGLEILDVGAGVGHDAIRYLQMGSRVTALEYNPVSIERGLQSVPDVTWVGGFSHLLPFRDEQFDVICVNAALHHMRDTKQAIREMFRALKPGGILLTCGDPFRPRDSAEQFELDVFDSHPAVLNGINEGIPNIGDLLDPIQDLGSAASGFVVTHGLRSVPSSAPSQDMGKGYRQWSLEDADALSQTSGSIAIRLRKERQVTLDASIQNNFSVRPGDFYAAVWDLSKTMEIICPVLPEDFINRPIIPRSQSWFDLLNGWKSPKASRSFRNGFGRGRWFMEKSSGLQAIRFDLGWQGKGDADFEFLMNGHLVQSLTLKPRSKVSARQKLLGIVNRFPTDGLSGRIARRLSRILTKGVKPFHAVRIELESPLYGRCAFEIRNLNRSDPGFTISNRELV